MTQFLLGVNNKGFGRFRMLAPEHFTFIRFFKRYPLFLLAFGPPIIRSNAGINAISGNIDVWAFIQAGLLGMVAFRAIWRLMTAESICILKKVQDILKCAFFLGLLYLVSSTYSPSHLVSASYSILYLLAWICVAEFIVDAYRNPPDWLQCLFQLRLVAFLLLMTVLLVLPFNPQIVMSIIPGAGIRLMGGAVAPMGLICPLIAIISAYAFCYGLEPKSRSVAFFLVGLASMLSTQIRGGEYAFLLCLAIVGFGWASTSKQSAYRFISIFMAFILFFGAVVNAVGGEHIWSTFNRGQSARGIASMSGRTQVWQFVVQYCLDHPQGMGYIAGFRIRFQNYFTLGLQVEPSHIGVAHNTFIQVLADAGWLAFAIYIFMLIKVIVLGWRFAKKRWLAPLSLHSVPCHAIRCSLILLVFCLVYGMDGSDFVLPLRASFYMQNIIIGIILGASTEMLIASRVRHIYPTK